MFAGECWCLTAAVCCKESAAIHVGVSYKKLMVSYNHSLLKTVGV